MRKAIRIIARLAEETQSVVVDGGTQAGIMTEIGKQRKQNKFSFPLIGVVFDSLLMKKEPQFILDPNHTHFFLIPGDHGGMNSLDLENCNCDRWRQKINHYSCQWWEYLKTDVGYSVLEDRPTFVMRGTGRMADQITLGEKIVAIDISQKLDAILEYLKLRLI